MKEVSVIGLGEMGAALAGTLLRNGYRVTVWNRTSAKAEPLVREGAILASDVAAAVAASPVVLVCITDYATTFRLLRTEEAAFAIAGKVLVQLTTGTPQDARESELWARERGAEYLDGAILATPRQVGRPDTPLFISGSVIAFQKTESLLKILAGGLSYKGEAVGAASAWDLAFLSHLFGGALGFFHGARIFEAEGIRVDALGGMLADIAPVIGEMIRYEGEVIQNEAYDNPESSLQTCAFTFDLLLKQAQESGIGSEFPTYAAGVFQKGLAAGYGAEELGALIKVLRTNGARQEKG